MFWFARAIARFKFSQPTLRCLPASAPSSFRLWPSGAAWPLPA